MDERDRMTMPGAAPTNEDLRLDAELTRQELAETVAALGDKVDVKARAQHKTEELKARAHEKTEEVKAVAARKTVELQEKSDEMVAKLPPPVAEKVRPAVDVATRNPAVTAGAAAGIIALLIVLLRILKR